MLKIYYLFFYSILINITKGKNIKERLANANDNILSSIIILGVFAAMLFLLIILVPEIIAGHYIFDRYGLAGYIVTIMYQIFIFLFIYFTLLRKDRWKMYIPEFKSYSRKKLLTINIFVILFIIFFVFTLVITCIIWKTRKDAGLILPY